MGSGLLVQFFFNVQKVNVQIPSQPFILLRHEVIISRGRLVFVNFPNPCLNRELHHVVRDYCDGPNSGLRDSPQDPVASSGHIDN